MISSNEDMRLRWPEPPIDQARAADLFAGLQCPAALLAWDFVRDDPSCVDPANVVIDLMTELVEASDLLRRGDFPAAEARLGNQLLSDLPLRSPMIVRTQALRGAGRLDEANDVEQVYLKTVRRLRGDLHLQGHLKKALPSRMRLEDAAALFTSALGSRVAPVLGQRTFQDMRGHLLRDGLSYGEIDTPRSFLIRAPSVFGSAEDTGSDAIGRTVFVGAVSNASVRHRSSLIGTNGHLLLDVQGDELETIRVIFHVDPAVMDAEGSNLITFEQSETVPVKLTEAVHLGGVPSSVFGHWLIQYLLKFFAARFAGLLPDMPILIDSEMPPSHREALAYFLGDDSAIVEIPSMSVVHVDRLWLLGDWVYVPICPEPGQCLGPARLSLPPLESAAVIRAMVAAEPEPARTDRKLFLARRPIEHRKMVNHEKIEDAAKDLGFEIVHLEDHSFRDQISMIRSAVTIAGPDGSSHIMGMFARPGTKITILSHCFMENNASLAALLSAIGLDVLFLQGCCTREDQAYRRFSDYEIDEIDFRRVACR